MTSASSSSIRILLLDHSTLMREGLRLLLESRNGFQVVGESGTAQQALSLASQTQPEIILLELNLDADLTLDNTIYPVSTTPDVIPSFSSRGPGVGNVLKLDITVPGVNILAQGYDITATGEARHLGYGQSSGTSMAAPHVAGAAALLRQIHPDWSNASIKSALMSTSNISASGTTTASALSRWTWVPDTWT